MAGGVVTSRPQRCRSIVRTPHPHGWWAAVTPWFMHVDRLVVGEVPAGRRGAAGVVDGCSDEGTVDHTTVLLPAGAVYCRAQSCHHRFSLQHHDDAPVLFWWPSPGPGPSAPSSRRRRTMSSAIHSAHHHHATLMPGAGRYGGELDAHSEAVAPYVVHGRMA